MPPGPLDRKEPGDSGRASPLRVAWIEGRRRVCSAFRASTGRSWAVPDDPGEFEAMRRKLRVGMVGGGGPANFFGAPHRRAILMDNSAELTAGALRSDPEGSIASARELFFARGYGDWQSMIRAEASLPATERIDYVTIVTPNDAHHGPADAAAAAGIGVLCEKPLTTTLDEARRLLAR